MRRRRAIATLALLPALLIPMVGCGGGHEVAAEAPEPEPVRAMLGTAERLELEDHVQLRGIVQAEQTATVSTRVMAMVTAVRVDTGDVVRKGQLLLEIDPQAATGQVAQAQGALGQARAALAMAQRNHERFQALAEVNAASELELDQARMQYEQALGAVEQAEGAVAAASSVAADSRVQAPFAGRVARRMVEVGDLAAPGRPLFMIESAGARRFALTVPEGLMMRSALALGDTVEVELDSRRDLGRLTGEVVEMSPGADPASHSFEVEISLGSTALTTGASGRAWIPSGTRPMVVIPAAAVVYRGGTTLVVVRDGSGLASSRVVTLGEARSGDLVEVLSGLAGGETLALGLTTVPMVGTPIEEIVR